MPYLFKVLRESLRFYPPIPIVFRRASEAVDLGGYSIPKNVCSIFHITSLISFHFFISLLGFFSFITNLASPLRFLQTFIVINIHHMHHHSPVWQNPEVFDPERY